MRALRPSKTVPTATATARSRAGETQQDRKQPYCGLLLFSYFLPLSLWLAPAPGVFSSIPESHQPSTQPLRLLRQTKKIHVPQPWKPVVVLPKSGVVHAPWTLMRMAIAA